MIATFPINRGHELHNLHQENSQINSEKSFGRDHEKKKERRDVCVLSIFIFREVSLSFTPFNYSIKFTNFYDK